MSGPANLTQWMQGLPIPWLVGGPNGAVDAASQGALYDQQISYVKQAVKARMPTKGPADALPHIGAERGLVQGGTVAGPAESNAAFGLRLRGAWDTAWPFGGSPLGILLQLYYSLGYTNVYYVQQNGLAYTLTTPPNADPTTSLVISNLASLPNALPPVAPATKTVPAGSPWFMFDGNNDFCSRFIILFPTALPASWTNVVNPPTSSSAPSLSEVNLIRAIVAQWKNAETTCLGIYAQVSGKLWGWPPTQVWGAATGNWGGSTVVFTP